MHAARVRIGSFIVAFSLLGIGCAVDGKSGAPGAQGDPGKSAWPVGSGIIQNLSLSQLEASGWRVCYQGTYADNGVQLSTVLSNCQGTYMMLACKPVASADTITLAAADNRAVVVPASQDAATATAFHASNNVGWYFTDTYSWGFFPGADTVNRFQCDTATTDPDKRLCWHAGTASGCADGQMCTGYRCGNNNLNSDATWQRLILVF